jgi:hypothetical protein
MEHLSWATLQSAAHLHHLAACVDAGQKTAIAELVAKRLLANQALRTGQIARHLIAGRRVQE